MPFKSQAFYLEECLSSIVSQQIENWELIAVDDYSMDESRLILENWASRDSRIKVIVNEGKGISDALNCGMEKSRADLIARMDADDVMCPDRLKKQYDFLSAHSEVGLVSSCVHNLNISGKSQFKGYQLYVEWINSVKTWNEISLNRFVESPFAHPSVVFRKELIRRFGSYRKGFFPEDYELWLRWMQAGVIMKKIDEKLLHWRDHTDRASRTMSIYSKEAFQRVKAKYFIFWLRTKKNKSFIISAWGAGKVARRQAQYLIEEGAEISHFYDVDPKKIGTSKNGIPVKATNEIPPPGDEFILILCGARKARAIIEDFLWSKEYVLGKNFLFLA